jgi:hypothetical protein
VSCVLYIIQVPLCSELTIVFFEGPRRDGTTEFDPDFGFKRDGTTEFDPDFGFKGKRDGSTEFDPDFGF